MIKRYEIVFRNEYYAESKYEAFNKQMDDIADQVYHEPNWQIYEKEQAPVCSKCNVNQVETFSESECEDCIE